MVVQAVQVDDTDAAPHNGRDVLGENNLYKRPPPSGPYYGYSYLVGLLQVLLQRPSKELGIPASMQSSALANPASPRGVGPASQGQDSAALLVLYGANSRSKLAAKSGGVGGRGDVIVASTATSMTQGGPNVLVLGLQARDPVGVEHELAEFL